MEISSSNHCLKKKRKKKKQSNGNLETVVKPESFDGMTNWMKLQQVGSLLSHTSEFLLGTLTAFIHFSSILCDIICQSLVQVRSCLSFISKKVLEKNVEDTVKKSSPPEGRTHFKKLYKKKGSKKNNQYKNPAKILAPKAQFKFDFNERKASLVSADSDASDHDMEEQESKRLTKTVSLDCEMVGTGPTGNDSILARVSIVNAYGENIYDEFVKPIEKVTDYRTGVSGVRPSDLEEGKALFEVQKDVLEIIKDRRVVGHDLKHDFDVLFISHPRSLIRDTARYPPFREISGGRTPSLRKLTAVILGCNIQTGEHNPIEDAQAAMLLYLRHKKEWERTVKQKRKK